MRRRSSPQQRLDQRIMCAPQNQRVCIVKSVGESLAQVDASDLFRHRMLDPSLLYERNKRRTALPPRFWPGSLKRFAVSVTAHRSLGADDHNFFILADR